MSTVNAILKAKIEGIIYEIMLKTGAANIYVDETTTLATKLAEIIADVDTKATKTELSTGLSTRAGTSHTHAQTDVTGLVDALAERPTTTAMNTAISTAISDLINGAPETYDTLKEISDYITAHQEVVDALNAAIGQKANAATTLAGYGITDAMTATEINEAIASALASATGGESAAEVKTSLDNYKTSNDARVKAIEDDYLKTADKTALEVEIAKKSKIHFSSTEPTDLAEGDLWVHLQ